jgi:hypothetical protein
MMRIMTAAFAACVALLLTVGVFDSAPAQADGYYRHHYRGGHYRGYRVGIRSSYYSGRGYYRGRSYYSDRRYDGGYRTAYYDQPSYRVAEYSDAGYDEPRYYGGGYGGRTYGGDGYYGGTYGGGWGGGGWGGCKTAYLPYGWTWYRASSC